MLLIHGARAVIRQVDKTESSHNSWIKALIERWGKNKACVALANKNTRVIWALIAKGGSYQAAN